MKNADEKYPSVSGMSPEYHRQVVRDIFSSVTASYDFLNRLLSLRRDVAWRNAMIKRMRFFKTDRLLDVATGTADVAIGAARRFPRIEVVGLDPSTAMLDAGRAKVAKAGLSARVSLIEGDALRLPFPDAHFDAACVAFGMRNIPEKAAALGEMSRVVAPGGQVMVLEMGLPDPGFFREFYIWYMGRVMPGAARLFSSHPAAYGYLADSIMNFPGPDAFRALMQEQGISGVEVINMSFGITRLFSGIRR
jgi:demethylmenaquinone methyltransferase/2-methoxy-6-polyprenyl-1,4-benzoquinol methylase